VILLDTNILMYAAGAPHPNKAPAVALLARIAKGEVSCAIDAESLQEILHRYRSLNRWQDGLRVYDLALQVVPDVLAINREFMDEARRLMNANPSLMTRDAVHAAVVLVYELGGIYSFDQDFDRIPGVERFVPAIPPVT
jgi:predicted nucleic acid-binding protein